MPDWNPSQYLAFASERERPSVDLIAHIAIEAPHTIVDLGCGPGNSTAMLRQKFKRANITGIDSSPAMIDRARTSGTAAVFEIADVTTWQPSQDVDLVFSNSLFQWIPDHPNVLFRVFRAMKKGATLAIQMPDNLAEPCHRMMRETAANGPWKKTLEQAASARSPLGAAATYYDLLKPLASRLEVWRTTYYHALNGLQGIVDMLSSTGLRPFIEPLDEASRQEFLAQYRDSLKPHYPLTVDGKVLLPFPRFFVVAIRADSPAAL
jgi:trans-aconitate 2-methyltransferase